MDKTTWSCEYEWDFISGSSKEIMWLSFDVERNWSLHKERTQPNTERNDECDTLTILWLFKHYNGIFFHEICKFTVMQLKESWLMFYNLYSCFDIFLTILLLLTIDIFVSVYVDMCSPINVVPIFTFKMKERPQSSSCVSLLFSLLLHSHFRHQMCGDFTPTKQILCATSWLS